MVKLDKILLGYCVLTVEKEDIGAAINIFLKSGVSLKINKDGKCVIRLSDRRKIEELLAGGVKYSLSEPRGIFGALFSNRQRFGFFAAIVISVVLLFLSSDIVWDVRIEGAEGFDAEAIICELKEAGFSVGKRWSRIDTGAVEINMLKSSERVGWLNINRRGCVAYVKVSNKPLPPDNQVPTGYASIVASRDCVIEEIIVECGYPLVKKGESVRAGQVLISGAIPSEIGGGFCYARGEVKGRFSEEISVSVAEIQKNVVYGEDKLIECTAIIFGFSLNIFKNYRQDAKEYDIINKTDDVTLLKKLPISVVRTYRRPYSVEDKILTEEEMAADASAKLTEKLLSFLSDMEAVRLKTRGEFSDNEYVMTCDALVIGSVAEVKEFQVSKEQ